MNIQKQREAFEKFIANKYKDHIDQRVCINSDGDYMAWDTQVAWATWQAAQAHEAEKLKGCVLVPVQCPDPDFADSLFDELSKKAIGEFGDDLLIHFSDIDEEKIWALMVEAAKDQAVPEGFVLVSKTPSLKVLDRLYAEHDIDEERATYIYRDIIEAQEPTND